MIIMLGLAIANLSVGLLSAIWYYIPLVLIILLPSIMLDKNIQEYYSNLKNLLTK